MNSTCRRCEGAREPQGAGCPRHTTLPILSVPIARSKDSPHKGLYRPIPSIPRTHRVKSRRAASVTASAIVSAPSC